MTRALGIAAFGVALASCGGAFGSLSLAIPGAAMALLGMGAPVWARAAAVGVRLARRPDTHAVEEGASWTAAISIRGGLLGAAGVDLHDPALPAPARVGRERRTRVRTSFPRRGRATIPPARLVFRDPLGVVEREVAATAADEVLVLPRIQPVALPPDLEDAFGEGDVEGHGAREAAFDLEGLGPHRPGTPPTRIHWGAVARHDELLERRFVSEGDTLALVVLDGRVGDGDFDEAVRAAASLIRRLATGRGAAALLPGERHPTEVGPDLQAWPRLHTRLALLQPDGRAPDIAAHPAGAVFWVTAAALDRVPRDLDLRAATVPCFLVGPGNRAGAPAFAVGNSHGWRLAGTGARRAA